MYQIQALQLGFKNFLKVSRWNLSVGAFVPSRVNVIAMRPNSKQPISSLSKPFSMIDEEEKNEKKVKALMGSKSNHEENSEESCSVEIESFVENPSRIEKMTFQELRTTLRSIGLPAKGNKRDLVSSLKLFVEKKINGESSKVTEDKVLSIAAESVLVEREAEILCDEDQAQDVNSVSDVHELQRTKRRLKQATVEVKAVKAETNVVSKKQKIPQKLDWIQTEPWTRLAHQKPQKDWIPYNPRTMRSPTLSTDTKSVKVMSWNVNGLRALLKLEGFSALELAQREDFDILCLQETKLQEKDVEKIKQDLIDGYDNSFWTCSVSKLGYSGTAIISRIKPLSVRYGIGIADHDTEGRLVTAEFDSFYLINGYVPNSGDGLRRLSYRIEQWDPSLSSYMKDLEKSKPVILTGDLNCAHQEIDIFNPAGNKRSAGFTEEERQSFGKNFLSNGFVDTFRRQHPNVVGYTYWGFRHGGRKSNKGWRLDYFLVSDSMADKVHDSYIVPDVLGSDHCPIGLTLKL
ncbi:hypothetical protein UlMin_006126 [Ulmus minor]